VRRSVGQARSIPGASGAKGDRGSDGAPGTSPIGQNLGTGDANCPNGGVKYTDAGGGHFVYNGANGTNGKDGADGKNGVDGKDGSSLNAIEDLNGLTCTDENGRQPTIETSVAAGGTITLTCPAAPAPPPPPLAAVTLDSVGSFGTMRDNSAPRTHTFVLSKGEAVAEAIDTATATDAFEVVDNSCGSQILAGATCGIAVRFDPLVGEGSYSGQLTVNGPSFTVSTALTATVIASSPCLRRLTGAPHGATRHAIICP
jgi:hypothetical protein